MPNCTHGGRWIYVLAVLLACLPGASPAPAQVFNFDNVVMLANREMFAGYNDVWGFVGNDGREYIIQGLTTGTAWWDVQDPINPVLVAVIPATSSTWRDMFVIGDYAYIGCEGSGCGIQIVDISDPTAPVLVTTYTATVGQSHNIFGDAARNLLFVFGAFQNTTNGGVQILDLTNPIAPVEIGQWDNFYVHDATLEGTLLHLCLIGSGRLRIIDTVVPSAPTGFGSRYQDPTGSVHASWPVGDGIHVLITEETTNGHLKSLDRSVPTNITLASQFNPYPGASAHNVHVEGTRAYVAWYGRGTRIVDISDPTNLTELGFWDTYPDTDAGGVGPGNWGTYPNLPSGTIASNDGKYGLFLLKYDPTAGTIDGTVSSSAGGLLSGATAQFVDLNLDQTTDATGAYKFSAFAGSAQVVFSAFGHDPDTINVTVPSDGTITTNVVLTKQPAGALDGTVTDATTTLPLVGVEIAVVGTPLTAVTDSTGTYSFPDVPSAGYSVDFLRYGYAPQSGVAATVSTGQTTTTNVQLLAGAVFSDFSTTAGWTISNTETAGNTANATGEWEFGEPNGTFQSGVPFQTDLDHTLDPEDQAAITGNGLTGSIGGDDVDSLTTRLVSPVYDLSTMSEPHIFYYRWYAVNSNGEALEVEATSDGGSNWIPLESTVLDEPFWKAVDLDLTGLLATYNAVQFRFTAQDPFNSQVVEAALDDVTIYDAGSGAVDSPVLPDKRFRLELAQNFPNPWAKTTEIRFAIPAEEYVQVSIYDVRGARIATVVDGLLAAGPHRAAWDGLTFTGKRAASGMYFYKLQTKNEIRTRKMVRLN